MFNGSACSAIQRVCASSMATVPPLSCATYALVSGTTTSRKGAVFPSRESVSVSGPSTSASSIGAIGTDTLCWPAGMITECARRAKSRPFSAEPERR